MENKSLEMLEFPRVREILAGFTSFSVSREMVLGLLPSSDIEQVSLKLNQSAEARKLLSTEPDFSLGDINDIRESVKLTTIGKALEPQVLLDIQRTLAGARYLHSKMGRISTEIPLLWNIANEIVSLPQLEKDIANCISPGGELMDTASEKLAEFRLRLRETRGNLMSHLDSILKSENNERYIQEALITERDGRYVIPVKIELRKEFKGIVHDISNTGATAFVEPLATVDMGNELRELIIEERREVERILLSLSGAVAANEEAIARNIDLIAELDLALAKARYAGHVNAIEPQVACSPGITGSGILRLINARHPLLRGKAVPLTVEIGKDISTLVITGPNTGGKTVALKTIGLLSLMAQAGIPIPAAQGSCIPIFDNVFADIGDEQSIEQTLSTFSWHISNIVRIIRVSSEKSLVLLDELGTSTDPGEGSALAQAILLHFLSRKVMTIATTHFSELKAFAHGTPGIQNASLDFDPVTLAPTYHLTIGIPGGSNALAIAAKLGLPEEIIIGARGRLSSGVREAEVLLADLMKDKQKLETAQVEARKDREEAENLKNQLQEELRKLKRQEQEILRSAREKLVREGDELQRQIRDAAAELKKVKNQENLEHARKALSEMREQLKKEEWKPVIIEGEKPSEAALSVGDRVWLKGMNVQGTILSLADEFGQMEVQVGQAKIKLSQDTVEKLDSTGQPVKEAPRTKTSLIKKAVPPELDLRGKRADEIEVEVDVYLNDALLANLAQVRIIHGFGTGTVRQIVRDMLASHPLVQSFRSGEKGEGGNGVTVVKL